MKVIVAKTSGFCAGVAKAVAMAVEAADRYGRVYSDGPLMHNSQAVEALAKRGVVAAECPPAGSAVVIRAHGVPPSRLESLKMQGYVVIDATCPKVAANQEFAVRATRSGKTVIMAGDRGHAEAAAVLASAGETAALVSSPGEVALLPKIDNPVLIAQTTFDPDLFAGIAKALATRFPSLAVRNTICGETGVRLAEMRELAREVESLIVVGGRHSANTKRLIDAGRAMGKSVFAVETAAEIDPADFGGVSTVGIVAGASTPGWIVGETAERMRRLGNIPPVIAPGGAPRAAASPRSAAAPPVSRLGPERMAQ